jgi:hypothetical protein
MDEEGEWIISVSDFYDRSMEDHEVYREIAETIIPLAGGLVHSAEKLHPTKRGCVISYIAIYGSGDIEMHLPPMDTPDRKQWMLDTLDAIKRNIKRGLMR